MSSHSDNFVALNLLESGCRGNFPWIAVKKIARHNDSEIEAVESLVSGRATQGKQSRRCKTRKRKIPPKISQRRSRQNKLSKPTALKVGEVCKISFDTNHLGNIVIGLR